jgi:hypothetical protein
VQHALYGCAEPDNAGGVTLIGGLARSTWAADPFFQDFRLEADVANKSDGSGHSGWQPLPPLPPLPPLQPLQGASDEPRSRRKGARLLSWATLVAAAGALIVGVLHGLGARIFDVLWPHVR